MIQWLFANSRDLLHVADRDGRLELVNPAWCETVGLAERELIGRAFLDFVHPEDADGLRAAATAAEAVLEQDLRLRRSDGSWGWFAARRQPHDEGREIVSLRDAAEAHARDEEFDELHRARQMLGRSAGIALWTLELDPHDGQVQCARQMLQLFGQIPDRMATRGGLLRHISPSDLRRIDAVIKQSIRDGQPGQLEYRVRGPHGWRKIRATLQPEARRTGYAVRGLTQDITELADARDAAYRGERRMREARREALASGQRLKLALEVAQAGVYEIDHVAKAFWASPELLRLTGDASASYADATELRYPPFHPDDLQQVRECFRALHQGERRSGEGFEARILDSTGQPRWVRIFHHLQVARNGRWLKAVGLLHDIDADKRQELDLIAAQRAAEAAGEAKAAFLANMSHEIRTPMNGVLGVLHLLKTETLSADGRMLLDEAQSCGQMLAELLNDVIDFSKIEAGCLELTSAPVDPQALVDGVLRLLRPQLDAKALTLTVERDPSLGWVRADPVRLRQALFNLIGNAVKFTPAGRISVRCSTPSQGRLRFEVEDTGVGIPAEAQARIFDRFDQGDASTTRQFGGSGLGLSITRKLSQMMGGDVGFVSREGVGSTFWLEVAAETADAETPPAPQAAPEAGVLAGLRLLVVEDNSTNRIIATKLLEQLGASVETAADGFLGVEAAARGGFDLILMDVQMPGIDGLEAARRVRALPAPIGQTPIVALTANVLAHQRQAYLDAGMDGVVGKPISPGALLAEITRLGGAAVEDPRAAVA
jgi:PAS domain S-box-containing protein